MNECGPIRTALFVPGNRPERIDKAVTAGADATIIDLEDAVPLSQKVETRAIVREKVLHYKGKRIIVRINSLGSEFARGDLQEIIVEGLAGIMIPKVDSAIHIQEANTLLLEMESGQGLKPGSIMVIPLIESALGVENVFSITSLRTAPHRLFTVAFGAADYALDMGIELTKGGEELLYARSRIAVGCRAAGVDPPIDTPFMIDLQDREALIQDVKRAKALGFQGKLCIHPHQVLVCNELFSPTSEEVAFAEKVVAAFEEAEKKGSAAIQVNGKFVDYPVVERSRRIVKMASMNER